MSSTKKTLRLWIALCLLLVVGGGVALPLYARLRTWGVEDRIHGTFYPVADALYRYAQEHGRPADSLAVLVPQYLASVPSSKLTDPPTYHVSSDRKSWELVISSSALSQRRLYVCRSTQKFSPEESRRIILQYHSTWTVFPADT